MIKTILQIALFILILISYFYVLRCVLEVPFLLFGTGLAIWHNIRHRDLTPRGHALLARFEAIGLMLLTGIFILFFFYFRLCEAPWLKIWENPLIVGVLFLVLVHQAGHLKSYNPMLRAMASAALLWSWPIIILLIVGPFAPSYISPRTFQSAVGLSAILLLLAGVWSLMHVPTDIRSFESLDKRRTSLGESLERLQRVAKVIGDAEKWKTAREIISHVDQCYSEALKHLRRKRFDDADALIIQAEMEVTQVERALEDRVRLSLCDEMDARLKQAETDIYGLKGEFESAGLSAENLRELSNEIDALKGRLDELEMSDESFINRLVLFHN